jgi:3-oxoacyl-[acyl-carrier protein] reductase
MTTASDARPLAGRVALITGAARRSGRATAMALAADGAAVVLNVRSSRDEAEANKREIEAKGGKAMVAVADITDEAQVQKMIDAIVDRFGGLHILVNNAADRRQARFEEMTYADWKHITSIVLDGAFFCSRYAVPHMLKAGWGRIVNIGGIGHHAGFLHRAHVHAAKAGLEGLTRGLAIEYADKGITVNCVAPGRIGGPRSKTAGTSAPNAKTPPTGYEGAPEDIAAAIRYVCSPDARFVTGQILHVNGGQFMN